jgi:hypothetical protein
MIRNARLPWVALMGISLLPGAASVDRAPGADQPAEPKVVSINPAALAAIKAKLAADPKFLRPALDRLIKDADRALKQRPLSVLDKKKPITGADSHDYVSYAPYFWPDPDKPDGLPYVRKDGKRNYELVRQGDAANFRAVMQAVHTLAFGYYFTGDAKYAEHAATLLRAWFLDAKSRMNPNLKHGQAVPGGVSGRPEGVLEFRDMPQLVDALGLLEASPAWTEADHKAMRAWLGQYYEWLTTSPIGRGEDAATNNHGTWYDVQVTALALYLGKTDDAKRVAERFGERRIAAQVKPDGSQPRELARADSWHYSSFNLTAMMSMAELSERVGVNLWKYRAADGQSIRTALDYLTPYLDGKQKWPHGNGENHPAAPAKLAVPLLRAARGLGPDPYQKSLEALPRSAWESHPDRLLRSRP